MSRLKQLSDRSGYRNNWPLDRGLLFSRMDAALYEVICRRFRRGGFFKARAKAGPLQAPDQIEWNRPFVEIYSLSNRPRNRMVLEMRSLEYEEI
jgi:hypothetical protein